jgi:4-alpha-glucanotransferase
MMKEPDTERGGPLHQPRSISRARSIAAPCPIRFTRAICGDLVQAERREWWIANGLGGYAGGTIAGSLTRRYHGLLIAPIASPLGRRLILAKADATVIEGSRPLFTNRWKSGAISPAGYIRIGSFHLDYSVPVWSYEIGEHRIEARIWMEPGANTTYAAWRLRSQADATVIEGSRPLFTNRWKSGAISPAGYIRIALARISRRPSGDAIGAISSP